ncbi:RTC4-like domain-containing protein [Lophiotrema nucula]|uniref:Restriction of telomere capping protein 4 n=1 Tax=Lophiotrema nucula TaxID=690887 RepID=A0A6A5ZFH3_9PLEO|nr:RTC4-like domain-containing protein [Lophiotrema nucula]
MPILQRTTQKLLRVVNGKEHASSEDHEEDDPDMARAYFGYNAPSTKTMDEEDILADPASSSDEQTSPERRVESPRPLNAVPKRTAPVQNIFVPPQGKNAKRPSPSTKINAPRAGTDGKAQTDKLSQSSQNEDKENASRSPASSASKRSADDSDRPFGGMEYGNRTKLRRVENTTKKTFVKSSSAPQRTFGKLKSYGSKPLSQPAKPTKSRSTTKDAYQKHEPTPAANDADDSDASDASEISMMSLPEVKPKMRKKLARQASGTSEAEEELLDIKIPGAKGKKIKPASAAKPRPTLSFLDAYKNPSRSQTSDPPTSQKSNLDPNGSSAPLSPLGSDDEQERVEDLEQYLAEQQPTHSDDTCPICAEAVDQSFYWEWWKGKKDTIRNQSLFCAEHKRQTAIEEYTKKAYPAIDWSAIPDRIQQHHVHLIKVLKRKKVSLYRKELEEKAAQGRHKVSVHEFMRKDNGEQMSKLKKTAKKASGRSDAALFQDLEAGGDEEDDEDSSIPDSHTGYYGARGAQLFASTIVTQLRVQLAKFEFDPAVSFGGVGYFVQKVLVPECTIQLVVQDLEVSEAVARTVIEESAAVGRLVNEEVEDRVTADDSEDDHKSEARDD